MIRKAALKAAFALVLGTASALPPAPADAAEIFCRTAVGRVFSIDVPAGWRAEQVPGGCAAARTDGSEFISVAYYAPRGTKIEAFAEGIAEQMDVKPKIFRKESSRIDFGCTVNGHDISVSVSGEIKDFDDEFLVVARKGGSPDQTHILGSVKF